MLWSKERRLLKLQQGKRYFLIIALDHSLTSGPIKGIHSVREINGWVSDNSLLEIPSVVLNAGIIDKLDIIYKKNIIVQLMGLPDRLNSGVNKVQTATVKCAISLGATAVSVQLNLNSTDLNYAVTGISKIVDEAGIYGLPVLFMLNHPDYETAEEFSYAVRVCVELGADIIKTRIPSSLDERKKINPFTSSHPPVILAGGSISNAFESELVDAKEMGFSGVCVGRNIFQNTEPGERVKLIDSVFGAG